MNIRPQTGKITITLFLAQSLGSAGFIAVATVGAIAGAKLSGSQALAGIPSAVYLLGTAFTALGWGYAMDRIGRRGGLTAGLVLGIAGAGIATASVMAGNFLPFLAGMVLMGAANSALALGRFVAAEVNPPAARGRAISYVVLGGTVGAIAGPLLVGPTGRLATSVGSDELAGPFAAAAVLFLAGCLLVYARLRPDPRTIGIEISKAYPEEVPFAAARSIREIIATPCPLVAMTSMAIGQLVMVMLMVITSLHLKNHHHNLGDISVVFSSHTIGMYAFSVISGRLADRLGRTPVILIGASTLVLACLLAPLSPEVLPMSGALFLLGLGWNLCYVGGSSLLADHLSPLERARTQGFNDLVVGLFSAAGSLGSGLAFAAAGYSVMGLLGAALALVPLGSALWWQRAQRQKAVAV